MASCTSAPASRRIQRRFTSEDRRAPGEIVDGAVVYENARDGSTSSSSSRATASRKFVCSTRARQRHSRRRCTSVARSRRCACAKVASSCSTPRVASVSRPSRCSPSTRTARVAQGRIALEGAGADWTMSVCSTRRSDVSDRAGPRVGRIAGHGLRHKPSRSMVALADARPRVLRRRCAAAVAFNPSLQTTSTLPTPVYGKSSTSGVRLLEWRVLIVGGDNTAEVYNPATGGTATAALATARYNGELTYIPRAGARVRVRRVRARLRVLRRRRRFRSVIEHLALAHRTRDSPRGPHANAASGQQVLIAGGRATGRRFASALLYDVASDAYLPCATCRRRAGAHGDVAQRRPRAHRGRHDATATGSSTAEVYTPSAELRRDRIDGPPPLRTRRVQAEERQGAPRRRPRQGGRRRRERFSRRPRSSIRAPAGSRGAFARRSAPRLCGRRVARWTCRRRRRERDDRQHHGLDGNLRPRRDDLHLERSRLRELRRRPLLQQRVHRSVRGVRRPEL